MKVLSWDIGIKNLAFCILSLENTKWKIHKWDIIDLSTNDNQQQKISCSICNKPAKLFYTLENKSYYVCGTHKTIYKPVEYVFEDTFIIKTDKVKCCCCTSNGKYEYNTERYCKSHSVSTFKKLVNGSKLVPIPKNKSVMKIKIDDLVKTLFTKLDKIPELLQVDLVLIENQPGLKNPTMKTLSSCVFSYFMLRGIIDASSIKSVNFMCPSNKLKLNENNTLQVLSKTPDGQKYKMTKELGIKYCKQMIAEDVDNLTKLQSYKKKDDLCDAFLQGAYYINKFN